MEKVIHIIKLIRNTTISLFVQFSATLSLVALAHAEPKSVQDVIGRHVTVDLPVKSVVLGFYFEDYMAIGGEKAFDHVVGLSREAWEGWVPANWAMHTAHRPSLRDIADVGEVEA